MAEQMKLPFEGGLAAVNTTPPPSPGDRPAEGAADRKEADPAASPPSSGTSQRRRAANPSFNSASVRLQMAKNRAKRKG